MALCKNCGIEFDWGQTADGRWVPLEKKENDSDLRKTYVDTDGVLRADHRERCSGVPLMVTRLKKPVPAKQENPHQKRRKAYSEGNYRMPLNTQILRNGETLKLKWTDFHVAAMVCASAWDSGKGPFEDNTPAFKWGDDETLPKEWRGKGASSYPEVPCPVTPGDAFQLAMYHVIGATPLNNGPYTLKKKHKFVDTTDSEVLELLPGDVLKAWRLHK